MLMMIVGNVQAQTWNEFENKTYLGGYYAAVCTACLDGTYHDGDVRYWRCDNSQIPYSQGCAKGILDAILGRIETTRRR